MPDARVSAREIAYDLLTSAILEIRAATEAGRDNPEAERQFANLLSHLAHNWSIQLRSMTPGDDYEALLRQWWTERDKRSDPWLRDRMTFFGWLPE